MSKQSQKRPARPRVPVPLSTIQEELRAQLKFLGASCKAYDDGDRDEFRRIALAVRVLVYDQGKSKSIVGQLGLKSVPFKTFSPPVDPTNLLSEHPLIMMRMGQGGAVFLPLLDQGPFPLHSMAFDDWWTEEVFRSSSGIAMARSGFILHTANQAGGAHVDPDLDEEFHKIAKKNEAGWVAAFGGVEQPMEDLEKACVRQIGFEVLQTLEPEWERIRGNRLCDCGSGKKYRYCHGKPASTL